MKPLPQVHETLLVRTDFSDETAWQEVCAGVRAEDPEYQAATTEQLVELASGDSSHVLMFIADETTISRPDHPILVVDLVLKPGRTFRTIPAQVFGIDSNLSIGNADWEDFAELVDDDGVFRGLSG